MFCLHSLFLPFGSEPSMISNGPVPTARRRSNKQVRQRSSSNSDSNEAHLVDFDWDAHLAYVHLTHAMSLHSSHSLAIRSRRDLVPTLMTFWKTRIQASTSQTKRTRPCLTIPGRIISTWTKVRKQDVAVPLRIPNESFRNRTESRRHGLSTCLLSNILQAICPPRKGSYSRI